MEFIKYLILSYLINSNNKRDYRYSNKNLINKNSKQRNLYKECQIIEKFKEI